MLTLSSKYLVLGFAQYNGTDESIANRTYLFLGFAQYNGSQQSMYVAVPYQNNYHKTEIKETLDLYTPYGMWCKYTVRVCMCQVHVCVHHTGSLHSIWHVV